MKRSAFTMVELIFVIVIIGILASMALPKLGGVTDGAKSAEIATISALSTAIENANGEWSINEGSFSWGINRNSSELNSKGYPTTLSNNGAVFGAILKGDNSKFSDNGGARTSTVNGVSHTITILTGPASSPIGGVSFDTSAPNSDIPNKPDKNDFWIYAPEINGTSCSYGTKEFFSGDLLLIDVTGEATTNYANIDFDSCTP